MIEATKSNVKIALKGDNSSFSYSHIDLEANDNKLYSFAEAINSLKKEAGKVVKVVVTDLVDVD